MSSPQPPRYTPILPLDETALGNAADRLEAWLAFAKTNRPDRDNLSGASYERYPIGDADLEILLLDFRHHRPTQWAYDRSCEAREKHRQRAEHAEAERDQARAEVERLRAALDAALPEGLYENWAVGYTDPFGDQHHVQYGAEESARNHLPTHPRGAVLQRRWQSDWATVYPQRATIRQPGTNP